MSTNFQLTNSNVKKKSKIVNYALNLKDVYRNEVKPSRQKYFDKLIDLYIDRKLENKKTLQNAIDGLRYNDKKLAKDTIKKYKDSFTKAGIIKGQKIEHTYNLTAVIDRTIRYKTKKHKQTGEGPMLHEKKYSVEEAKNVTKGNKLVYSLPVKARSIEEAQQIFLELMQADFNDDSYSFIAEIDNVTFTSNLDLKTLKPTKTENMFLRRASQVKYDFIKEEVKFLRHHDECVIDNFIGVYGDKIKKLTRESLIQQISDYYNPNSALDEGIDIKHDASTWSLQDGVTPECIDYLCRKYDISHYAYDILQKCFMKYISKNQNLPALAYYALDGHMYLIKDAKLIKSLVEKAKVKDLNSVNLNENLCEKKSPFEDADIHENVDVKDITTLIASTNVIIYSRPGFNSINDILIDCIKLYGVPSKIKNNRSQIQQFAYTINNINYILCNDPNDVNVITWKTVQEACIKHKIVFRNQTFTQFCSELKEKFETPVRKEFNDDEKRQILKLHNFKCKLCDITIGGKVKFDIDHIRPLSNGGSNELDNIQPLCKPCHKDKTLNEQLESSFNKIDDAISTYNNDVSEIMTNVKSYAFVETINEPINETDTLFTLDIKLCRTYILKESNTFDYPVFTVMDKLEPYKNHSCPGVYYVQTKNYFPMRGDGWYYNNMIEYALTEKLITTDDIKYVIKSSLSIPSNYYNKWINHVFANLEQAKLAINSMIGSFNYNAEKHENWSSMLITAKSTEAMQKYIEHNGHFIDVLTIDKKDYYHVFKKYDTHNLESKANIYHQIVQQENIELHKLSKIIEAKGGRVLDLMTDAITCTFPNNELPFDIEEDGISITGHKYKDGKSKYKLEEGHRVKIQRMKKHKLNTQKPRVQRLKYKIFNDVKDNDFTPLVKQMLDLDKSFIVHGCPGVGKSHFTRLLQDELTKRDKKFVSLAPTNKASLIIRGRTLNKFRIKLKTTKRMNSLNLDYIIVDEISMMKEEYYSFLKTIKTYKPSIKFILVGDYNQLDPVNDRIECDYGNSKILHELSDGNKLILTKCRRADDELFNMLQFDNIPNIKRENFTHNPCKINVCYTNETRMLVNDTLMEKFKTKSSITLEKISGDANSQKVILTEGMPIIGTKNNKKFQIINNQQYGLFKIDGDVLHIREKDAQEEAKKTKKAYKGNEIKLPINQFQRLFYPAYAITTHKMQGETINKPYTIHDFDMMDQKLKYVALTRATNKQIINII
jgi:hypothetical protein